MRVQNDCYKINSSYGSITHHDGWGEGFIVTKTGIVDIMTDSRTKTVRYGGALNGKH